MQLTNGFMIQVQECGGLGAGQEIETEMAQQLFSARTDSVFPITTEIMRRAAKQVQSCWPACNLDLQFEGMT